jgi:hypothetical protein
MNLPSPVSLKKWLPLAALLAFFGLAACEDEPGCVTNNSNRVRVGFFRIDDTTTRNADQLVISGVVAVGGGGYRLDTTREEWTDYILFLNPSEDVSTFYLIRGDGTADTLVLRYQREQQLISPDCGPTQRFFNLIVDTTGGVTTLDSFRLVEPELSALTPVNLEIYTCQDFFYTDTVKLNFQERDTLVRTDSLFIRTITDGSGRVLVADDTVFGRLDLPINPQADQTEFVFDLLAHGEQPARVETITLTYEQEAVRFAEHCRPQTRFFNLDTLAGTTFDSVRVENRELAVDVSLNLRIVDFIP